MQNSSNKLVHFEERRWLFHPLAWKSEHKCSLKIAMECKKETIKRHEILFFILDFAKYVYKTRSVH